MSQSIIGEYLRKQLKYETIVEILKKVFDDRNIDKRDKIPEARAQLDNLVAELTNEKIEQLKKQYSH